MNGSVDTNVPISGEIGVLGGGAWGSALALTAARAGRQVKLWALEPEIVASINADHANQTFLPGVKLPEAICATSDMKALAGCAIILAASPAQHTRATLRQIAPLLPPAAIIALCAKGVEQSTLSLMSDILTAEAPAARGVVLSGPGFAKDVARGLPTAITIASADQAAAQAVIDAIGSLTFRPYHTDDVIGAQIGGAVKNVIAVACGIAEGRKLGEGARAALVTRGFAEMTRLALARGAKLETLNGLAGLGDLVLTCVSASSRNTSFGMAIGAGESVSAVLARSKSVVEGATSAPAVVALAKQSGVDMPICAAVDALIAGRIDVERAIMDLLSRPFRAEGL